LAEFVISVPWIREYLLSPNGLCGLSVFPMATEGKRGSFQPVQQNDPASASHGQQKHARNVNVGYNATDSSDGGE
jgi:hypothetical protein